MLCTQVNAITLKKSDVEIYLANKYVVGDINPDVPVWPLFVRDAADENQKPVLFVAMAVNLSIYWCVSIPKAPSLK